MEPAVDLQDFMQLEVELLHLLGGLLLQSSWTHSVLWSTYLLKLDVGLRQLTLAAYAFSKQDSVASQVKFNGDFLSESEQAKYNRYYYFVFLNILYLSPQVDMEFSVLLVWILSAQTSAKDII